MGIITLFFVGLGLSFDTFAVCMSTGLIKSEIRFFQGVRVAFVLAFFQALMPLIGWFVGTEIAVLIGKFDHWIAFGLLFLLSSYMIYETLKNEEKRKAYNPLIIGTLVIMALATSIDALIVGLSLAFANVDAFLMVFMIGAVTFLVSMIGMLFGKKIGNRFGNKIEVLGGVILILIGLKVLMSGLEIISF